MVCLQNSYQVLYNWYLSRKIISLDLQVKIILRLYHDDFYVDC